MKCSVRFRKCRWNPLITLRFIKATRINALVVRVIIFYILACHFERPNPLGANIEKEVRHPEQSEGSPDVREMSRQAQHDVLLCEHQRSNPER